MSRDTCKELDKALNFLLKDMPAINFDRNCKPLTDEEVQDIAFCESMMDDMGRPVFDGSSPLAEALLAITGKVPPAFIASVYDTSELSDEQHEELQNWASSHCRPSWSTGIGTLDAANAMVSEAVGNANLKPKENCDE